MTWFTFGALCVAALWYYRDPYSFKDTPRWAWENIRSLVGK